MKSLLIAIATLFTASTLFAQSPFPQPVVPNQIQRVQPRWVQPGSPRGSAELLADNYQLTLTVTDKDEPPLEISVVMASGNFSTRLSEQNVAFAGSVMIEEGGAVVVNYSLAWDTAKPVLNTPVQSQASSAEATVRLVPGKEMLILKTGTRSARLLINKL